MPAKLVQRVMDALNEIARGGLLESLSASAIGIGHLGLIVGGAAVTLFAVVFAMRLDSLKLGILALLVPVAVAVLQFGDWKFLDLCGKVVRNTKTRTSSLALYQYVALLTMIAAAGSIAAGTYAMIEVGGADGRNYFLAALALAAYLAIVGLLFLTPDALNLEVDETCSAGEDGIGLIGTLLKAGLAAARLVFGTLCALGAVCAAIGAVWFTTDAMEPRAWLWFSAGLYLLVIGALNPIVLYLISVLYYILPDLVIGVIRHTRPRDA